MIIRTDHTDIRACSDFDGIGKTPIGLEDVSKYPNLIAELLKRGWSDKEVAGVASENLLRVLNKAEQVSKSMKGERPAMDIFKGRDDLHRRGFPEL